MLPLIENRVVFSAPRRISLIKVARIYTASVAYIQHRVRRQNDTFRTANPFIFPAVGWGRVEGLIEWTREREQGQPFSLFVRDYYARGELESDGRCRGAQADDGTSAVA